MYRDKCDLDEWRATLSTAQSALQGAREVVIEAVGDRLCGGGPGPNAQQLQRLATARRRAFVAKRKVALLSASLIARQMLQRLQRRMPVSRASTPRRVR